MQFFYMNDTVELNEDLIRHMILKSIRVAKRNEKDYGKLVISCDSANYWRKDVFPYYKIGRKKSREKSTINWNELYKYMRKIKEEIAENFSYIIIEVDGAESDDIIYTLVKNVQEKTLIISKDKDFLQLQRFSHVDQYNSVDKKKMVMDTPEDANKYLFEHIIRGDTGDSIPNIFSPSNSFVMNLRQKPAHKKKIELWWQEKKIPDEYKERFEENRNLIDLSRSPKEIQKKIMESYENQLNKKNKNLMNYFMEHNLSDLLSDIQDF